MKWMGSTTMNQIQSLQPYSQNPDEDSDPSAEIFLSFLSVIFYDPHDLDTYRRFWILPVRL